MEPGTQVLMVINYLQSPVPFISPPLSLLLNRNCHSRYSQVYSILLPPCATISKMEILYDAIIQIIVKAKHKDPPSFCLINCNYYLCAICI